MKILLAIDDSDASQGAVCEVASRPWPPGSSVEVLHVVDPWTLPSTVEEIAQRANALVDRAVEQLGSHGVTATKLVLEGDPKAVILDRAATSKADWVVVGSHGTSAAVRFLMGSVAAALIRYAPCSVAVIRPARRMGPRKILLATDGSPSAELAARSVADRPWPAGSEILVVSVAEPHFPAAIALLQPPFIESSQLEIAREAAMGAAQKAVNAALDILASVRLECSLYISVLPEPPKQAILDEALRFGADVIVMGSHGRRGVERFLLGSVSEAVASHADCSVEVIRCRPS